VRLVLSTLPLIVWLAIMNTALAYTLWTHVLRCSLLWRHSRRTSHVTLLHIYAKTTMVGRGYNQYSGHRIIRVPYTIATLLELR
jgi:hypothetical protein